MHAALVVMCVQLAHTQYARLAGRFNLSLDEYAPAFSQLWAVILPVALVSWCPTCRQLGFAAGTVAQRTGQLHGKLLIL